MIASLGKDTLIYGSSDILIKLITFFTFPVIAAALTPSSFGVLELITTLIGLLGLFMNCGLNNALHRFYWDTEDNNLQKNTLVTTGIILQAAFWLLIAGSVLMAYPLITGFIDFKTYGFTQTAVISAVLLIFVTQASQYIQDVIRLHFKPLLFLIFNFLSRALTAIAGLIAVVFLAKGIDGLLAAQVLIGLSVIPLGLFLIRRDLGTTIDTKTAKTLFQYGYPFIFMGLAYWLFSSMDRWMLSSLSSLEETGQYSVAFRFSSLVLLLSSAFGQAWSPYAIKMKTEEPDTYRKMYADVLMLLLFAMLIAGGGLALFSGEIIGLIMTDAYQASAIPFAILCFAIIFQSTQQITASGISLERKTHILAYVTWAAAAFNLIGNFLLIPPLGAVGASISTLLSYLFITSGYLYFTQKLHPLPIPWIRLGLISVLGLAVLCVSIVYNTDQLSIRIILGKTAFALTCLGVGYWIFPLKRVFKP